MLESHPELCLSGVLYVLREFREPCNAKLETRDSKPETRNPKPETRN
jgi:hypothetical protein